MQRMLSLLLYPLTALLTFIPPSLSDEPRHLAVRSSHRVAMLQDDRSYDYVASAEAYLPIVSTLSDGELMKVTFRSDGCFHHYSFSFEVIRKHNGLYLLFQNEEFKLDPKEIHALVTLEIRMLTMSPSGCTTVDTWEISSARRSILAKDGSCSKDHPLDELARSIPALRGILPWKYEKE